MSLLDRTWERPAPTRAQVRADLRLGVLAALVSVASVELFHSASGASLGWRGIEGYLWFGLAGLALAGRRRFPLTTLVVESVVFVVVGERMVELGIVFTIQMILFAALYAAWAWSRHTRALQVVTVLVLVAMFGWIAVQFARPGATPPESGVGLLPSAAAIIVYSIAINVVYFFGAIAWGHAAWLSARRSALIAEQREREIGVQDLERRQAVQAERVRIARDLHDVVAHHVSGIGVQAAGAGRLLDSRPEAARDALGRIESSSRQAVSQMHQLVGLLREADEAAPTDRGPQPGLDDVRALAVTTERPSVEVTSVGVPFDVPATLGVSLYRVVQEALTNVRRHSLATSARITVRHVHQDGTRAVEVEVLDDGPARGVPDAQDGPGGGFGIDGIRERAAMHGGVADVGPRPSGGFRVRVRVPVPEENP